MQTNLSSTYISELNIRFGIEKRVARYVSGAKGPSYFQDPSCNFISYFEQAMLTRESA